MDPVALKLRGHVAAKVMISATFGDEMWNTRNVGLTQAAAETS